MAVLSALAAQKGIESGTLHAVNFKDIYCDGEMFVVQDRRRVPPLPARLFLNFLDANPVPDLTP